MNRFTILFAILGFALIVVGAAWIYRPLGPLAAGLLLLTSAVLSMRRKA